MTANIAANAKTATATAMIAILMKIIDGSLGKKMRGTSGGKMGGKLGVIAKKGAACACNVKSGE